MTNEGLRERKKRQTRTALSWAAVRLVAERGYDAVRVEDIAAEAGVSVRTFGNYFGSKGEAIAARHVERVRQIADELRERPADEPLWDAIVASVMSRFALDETGHGGELPPTEDWVAGVRKMMAQPTLRGELIKAQAAAERELADAVAERTGTSGLYPCLVASVAGAAVATATEQWANADPPRAMADILAHSIELIRSGLPEPSDG